MERWLGFVAQQDSWRERLGRNLTLVAVDLGLIVGFAEPEHAGEVGYFSIATSRQRHGSGPR